MRWRTSVFSAALVCAATAAQVRAQSADAGLNDLVQSALTRNREILATRQKLAEAEGLLRQAGVRPSPTLEVEGGTGRPLGTKGEEEYSAGIFQPMELGGKRDKRSDVARISLDLARAELAERVRQLSFDVKNRAIEILAEEQKAKALERLAGVNADAYTLTEARVKEGDVAPLDAQLLLVEQNRAAVQRSALNGHLEADLVELRQSIGLGPDDPLSVEGDIPQGQGAFTLAALQELALRQRPDLQTVRLLQNQGQAELALAHAQSRPDVTLSAKFTHRSSAFDQLGLTAAGVPVPIRDTDNIVTVGGSIPLFSGSRNQGNIQAATARAAESALRREHLTAGIPLEVDAAYKRWRTAKDTLDIYGRGIVDQSEKNLGVIRQAYQLGQLRLLDVLNEQKKLIDTELAYIDAQAEAAKSIVEIERAIGGNLP